MISTIKGIELVFKYIYRKIVILFTCFVTNQFSIFGGRPNNKIKAFPSEFIQVSTQYNTNVYLTKNFTTLTSSASNIRVFYVEYHRFGHRNTKVLRRVKAVF